MGFISCMEYSDHRPCGTKHLATSVNEVARVLRVSFSAGEDGVLSLCPCTQKA